MTTDPSGRYSALHRPYHYIGLELGLSAASVVLRGEPTGKPMGFHGDVVATSKRATRSRASSSTARAATPSTDVSRPPRTRSSAGCCRSASPTAWR